MSVPGTALFGSFCPGTDLLWLVTPMEQILGDQGYYKAPTGYTSRSLSIESRIHFSHLSSVKKDTRFAMLSFKCLGEQVEMWSNY
jgi:hypothetical protein